MRDTKITIGKKIEKLEKVKVQTPGITPGGTPGGGSINFSLRSFMTTLLLMSHCTVEEKVSLLFDMYDYVDGSADGNMPSGVY